MSYIFILLALSPEANQLLLNFRLQISPSALFNVETSFFFLRSWINIRLSFEPVAKIY
jgi:hypothetical protein